MVSVVGCRIKDRRPILDDCDVATPKVAVQQRGVQLDVLEEPWTWPQGFLEAKNFSGRDLGYEMFTKNNFWGYGNMI